MRNKFKKIKQTNQNQFKMSSADICNADSAECERLLSNNVVQAQIYGSKDPVCFTPIFTKSVEKHFISGKLVYDEIRWSHTRHFEDCFIALDSNHDDVFL